MHSDVSFIEIGTSDTERTRPFFEQLFGWDFHPMTKGGGWFQSPSIRLGLHGDDPTPQLYVFFEVPDLEQAVALVQKGGGTVELPTQDEPGFGKFANCRDPQGIVFGLHQRPAA